MTSTSNELKTLKDTPIFILNEKTCLMIEGDHVVLAADEKELKQEAIKDIKAIRESGKRGEDFRIGNFCFYCCECVSSSHVTDYIKWKFNITEEDLG